MSSISTAIPFSHLSPLRLLSLNHSHPFTSILSDSKLLYISGSNILLENTKTNQQKIIYQLNSQCKTKLVVHNTTLYNQHIVGLLEEEENGLGHRLVVVPVNATMFTMENRQQHNKVYQLSYIPQYEQIQHVQFFQQGNMFGLISSYQHITNLSLQRTTHSTPILKQTFLNTNLLLSSTYLTKQNYITLLLQHTKDSTRLVMLAADQLSRRLYFTVQMENNQKIVQYGFEASHDENVYLLALTSLGFVAVFSVNQYQIVLITKIDGKITYQQGGMFHQQSIIPNHMQTSGNKIVLSYHNNKTIKVIQYSIFNPVSYKTVTLNEAMKQYGMIASVENIRISKDGCSLAVMCKVDHRAQHLVPTAITSKAITPALLTPALPSRTQWEVYQPQSTSEIPSTQPNQYIAFQIDLLSNLIDHSNKKMSISPTLSLCSGHAPILKAQYLSYNNTLMLLMSNKSIKYYDMTPTNIGHGRPQFKVEKLQLWACSLGDQAKTMAVHPFNYSLILIYGDLVKYHHYNNKELFAPVFVSPIANCKIAQYTPLGDKIVIVTGSALTVIDSYTFNTLNNIPLPNIQLSSSIDSGMEITCQPKTINNMCFFSYHQIMLLSGHNTLSHISEIHKSTHFGFIDKGKAPTCMVYDKVNQLAVVAQGHQVLVLSKTTLNSNNKCQVHTRMQIQASSLLQIAQLGVLFIGGTSGSLYMLKWPHYSQQDIYLNNSHRTYLFDEPIVALHIAPNMKQIYAISAYGAIAICEPKLNDGEEIAAEYKVKLLKVSQIPFRMNHCWLISKFQEEKKEREIIKLRGEEADNVSTHAYLGKDQVVAQEKEVQYKKGELEETYLTEIKAYETELGLKEVLQQIALLKDEVKLVRKQQQRQRADINVTHDEELHQLFEERKVLQLDLSKKKQQLQEQMQKLKSQYKDEVTFLRNDFIEQDQIGKEKNDQVKSKLMRQAQIRKMQEEEVDIMNEESKQRINEQFEEQKAALMEVAQVILSRNRSTHISSYCLQDKISEIGIQREKVEIDLERIQAEQKQLADVKVQLQSSLKSSSHVYNVLMKQSRELQQKLLKERRVAGKLTNDLTQIKSDLARLEDKVKQMNGKYNKMSSQFIGQKQQQGQIDSELQQVKAKIEELKIKKKEKLDKSCLAKTKLQQSLSTIHRQVQVDPQIAVQRLQLSLKSKSDLLKDTELAEQYKEHQLGFDKMARNASRWKTLKNSYMSGFRSNYHKLNDENIKLTYQYNDLFKVSQQYKTYLSDLRDRIEAVKREKQRSQEVREFKPKSRIRCSIFGKPKDLNVDNSKGLIRQKGTCVSLHQETGKFITQA